MIAITQKVLDEMIGHCRDELPAEGCGYLAEKGGVVDLCLPLTNTDHSAEHFTMDPEEQFAAHRKCRSEGYTIRAVYHSHPHTPARPSEEDLRLAVDPSLSYVIVSFAAHEVDVQSFVIRKRAATKEKIEIIT